VTPVRRACLGGCLLIVAACAAGDDRTRASNDSGTGRPSGSSRVESLLAGGDSLYRQSGWDGARVQWDSALALARAADDSAGLARALTGLGQVARQLGDFATSRRLGEQALALKQRLGLSQELFRSFNALGLLAWSEERLEDAASLLAQAAAAARTMGDSAGLARAVMNTGLVLQDLGAFPRAREAFESARERMIATGDTFNLARTLNNTAALDIKLGDPLSAIAGLEEARQLYRLTGDSLGEMNARAQLATAYDALGEPQRAFAAIDSALAMARRLGTRAEEADDLLLLGDYFSAAGDYQHALDHYGRAAALNDTLGRPEQRGNLLQQQARAHFALGNAPLAERRAREALRVHRDGGFRYPELVDLLLLAELAQDQGRAAEAVHHIGGARAIARELGVGVANARVTLSEARVAARAGDWPRVLRVLAGESPVLPLAGYGAVAEGAAMQARAYGQMGQLEAAAAAGRRAVDAVERVRGNYGTGELRTAFASDKASVYSDLVMVLLRLGRSREAFEVADAARGQALLEHLASARAGVRRQGSAPGIAEAEALLRRIDALVALLRERAQQPPRERSSRFAAVNGSLQDSIQALRAEYEALAARGTSQLTQATGFVSPARAAVPAVQASLQPGEVLLEYFVGPDDLVIFVLAPGEFRVLRRAGSADSLAARVAFARELLGRRGAAEEAGGVLRVLHRVLLGPVQETGVLSVAHTLIVVPHGVLAYLPFSALVDPATGRYVVESHAVMYGTTAAALPILRAQAARAGDGARATETAVFAPFPADLPASGAEARMVREATASNLEFSGARATEREVRRALTRGARVHVATHAVMNPRNPLFSRVDLARVTGRDALDDGRLEVHELLALRFESPLVFLSGCETAVGSSWTTQFDTGEDFTTIAQAWLHAGARNVVATLWRIDDVAAAEFARRFYLALSGRSVPEAVAMAQREMLADPSLRRPYLWAAYQATGVGWGVPPPANRSSVSVQP
jgi:CHAT domain-containing protein/tetratricopeptide (TPR) repeat protein